MENKLIQALEDVLKHLWDDRKRDVNKNYSLMVAEAQARTLLHNIKEAMNNMDGMKEYRVSLHEDVSDKFTILFDCWADDAEHAFEQAENAYPNGEILSCFLKEML